MAEEPRQLADHGREKIRGRDVGARAQHIDRPPGNNATIRHGNGKISLSAIGEVDFALRGRAGRQRLVQNPPPGETRQQATHRRLGDGTRGCFGDPAAQIRRQTVRTPPHHAGIGDVEDTEDRREGTQQHDRTRLALQLAVVLRPLGGRQYAGGVRTLHRRQQGVVGSIVAEPRHARQQLEESGGLLEYDKIGKEFIHASALFTAFLREREQRLFRCFSASRAHEFSNCPTMGKLYPAPRTPSNRKIAWRGRCQSVKSRQKSTRITSSRHGCRNNERPHWAWFLPSR